MTRTIRWGILGTGSIAGKFAEALARARDARLVAVGSRSVERARTFGARHGAARAHGSHAELIGDSEVDVVYVASPQGLHAEHCLLCLEAGKAVLCEKPFTTTAEEARRVIAAARRHGLFCMEAMWMRFHPLVREAAERVAAGDIGEPCLLRADLGYPRPVDPTDRLFSPQLGGGATLDLGVYAVSLAHLLFGEPEAVASQAAMGGTGVDEHAAFALRYPGRIASLSCSIRTRPPNDALILGTHGRIAIHAPFYNPERITWTPLSPTPGGGPRRRRGPLERLGLRGGERHSDRPPGADAMRDEAEEVVRCLQRGEGESARMPLDESLRVMQTLDAIRAPWARSLAR